MIGMNRIRKLRARSQDRLFHVLGMQDVLDRQERAELAHAMGFEGQWDEHRRFQMEFLKSKGVEPHHKFLEIGSGPLTLGVPMIDYLDAGNYVGVDVRSSVNNIAYAQIAKNALAGKNPRLITSEHFG